MGIQTSNGTVPLRTKFRLTMFRLTRVDCTFCVPASTLRDHISGFQRDGVQRILHLGATSGPATVLSVRSEARLVEFIALSRRLCNSVDKTHILQKAAEVEAIEARAQNREPKWPGGSASEKWWLGFKKRFGWCCGAARTQTWTDSRARHQRSSQDSLWPTKRQRKESQRKGSSIGMRLG
jgi:hypothetical protein